MGHFRYSIFDIRCSMFDIRYSMFDVRYSMFDVGGVRIEAEAAPSLRVRCLHAMAVTRDARCDATCCCRARGTAVY